MRREEIGGRVWREDGGEVNGNRADGRKEGDVFVTRLTAKHSMQVSGKIQYIPLREKAEWEPDHP